MEVLREQYRPKEDQHRLSTTKTRISGVWCCGVSGAELSAALDLAVGS